MSFSLVPAQQAQPASFSHVPTPARSPAGFSLSVTPSRQSSANLALPTGAAATGTTSVSDLIPSSSAAGEAAPTPPPAEMAAAFPLLSNLVGAEMLSLAKAGLTNLVKGRLNDFQGNNTNLNTNVGKLEELAKLLLGLTGPTDASASNQISKLVKSVLDDVIGGGRSSPSNIK